MKTGVVYEILVNGTRRYIGVTNNLNRRQKEHTRALLLGKDKYLYRKIRESAPDQPEIAFNQISDELPILHARRLEAKYILDDYFNKKELWQSPPFSFKYF
jgi:hypothetical protein